MTIKTAVTELTCIDVAQNLKDADQSFGSTDDAFQAESAPLDQQPITTVTKKNY